MRRPTRSLLACLLLSVAACGGGDPVGSSPPPPPPPPAPVASVVITPPGPLALIVGATAQLTATPQDAAGTPLTGRAIAWSSSAEAVATVSTSGAVTAVGVGSAQIRAASEGRTGEVTVNVAPVPVASVTLSPETGTLVPGQSMTLVATARDAQGLALQGRAITWGSSTEAAATVSQTGVVTGVAVGIATVTATSEGKSATAALRVRDGGWITPAGGTITAAAGHVVMTFPAGAVVAPTAITVDPIAVPNPTTNLIPGTGFDLGSVLTLALPVSVRLRYAASSIPAGIPASELRVGRITSGEWRDLAGSTVDLAGLSAVGAGSDFGSWGVVTRVLAGVSIPQAAPTVSVGNTIQLSLEGRDFHGLPMPIAPATWTSLSPGVATIGLNTGVVTAVAPGTAVMAGSSGGRAAEVVVTVVGAPPPPVFAAFTSLEAGGNHTCGLTAVGHLWCWGWNAAGALGDGTLVSSSRPVAVQGGHLFTIVAPGGNFTCGLKSGGAAWCWGENVTGAIGDGTTTNRLVPVAVSGGHSFVALSGGFLHACGLKADGTAWCWGGNGFGTLGNGTLTQSLTPTPVVGGHTFQSIAAGEYQTCGITLIGTGLCWGRNSSGQLGDGTVQNRSAPTPVAGGTAFASVSVEGSHSCGLTAAGAAWCWGANVFGRLGDGTQVTRTTPVAVAGGQVFAQIRAGTEHTCGVVESNGVWCWGRNTYSSLGLPPVTTHRFVPTAAAAGSIGLVRISVGWWHTCGLTNTGVAKCWGWNLYGQLGDGGNTDQLTAVGVLNP